MEVQSNVDGKHEHKFIIPVSWQYQYKTTGGTRWEYLNIVDRKWATKLACECGKTIDVK